MTEISHWLSTPRHGLQLVAFIIGALGVGFVVLGLLMSVPARYRKAVVAAVTFLGGLYFSLEFLMPHPRHGFVGAVAWGITGARPFVANASMVIWSFALFLGILNLFDIHGKAVRKRNPGWYNSAAFFIAFFAILLAGFLKDWRAAQLAGMTASSAHYAAVSGAAAANASFFDILFRGLLTALDATMFSLIAFYIVSAAYRAFRIRSPEAILMMAAAAIIMLALVPVGAAITNWIPARGILSAFRIENIGYWLLVSPNMTAQRAIGFGVAVGALAMGLRIWLSLEKGSFFDRQL
jgi:hypothetical protein